MQRRRSRFLSAVSNLFCFLCLFRFALTSWAAVCSWYPHYDGVQSFSDFTPFAGWTTPHIKQVRAPLSLSPLAIVLHLIPFALAVRWQRVRVRRLRRQELVPLNIKPAGSVVLSHHLLLPPASSSHTCVFEFIVAQFLALPFEKEHKSHEICSENVRNLRLGGGRPGGKGEDRKTQLSQWITRSNDERPLLPPAGVDSCFSFDLMRTSICSGAYRSRA